MTRHKFDQGSIATVEFVLENIDDIDYIFQLIEEVTSRQQQHEDSFIERFDAKKLFEQSYSIISSTGAAVGAKAPEEIARDINKS